MWLKSNRRFVYCQAISLRQTVNHTGGGDCSHYRATHATFLDKILERKGHDLVGINEITAPVHRSDAVGVAISTQTKVAHPRTDGRC